MWPCLAALVLIDTVRADQCDRKYQIIPDHTACLPKSVYADSLVVTPTQRVDIVSLHNKLRATAAATDMQKMVWDEELGTLAQKAADLCVFDHDKVNYIPDRFAVGQNIAEGPQTWEEAIKDWYFEVKDFSFGNKNNMTFEAVGHYTQLSWASSAKVGCGATSCSNLPLRRLFVCNYGPSGNLEWWKPYNTNGAPCSHCPSHCLQGRLCDCGGKVCENGGTLNLQTCKCTCSQPWYQGDICKLNCADTKDAEACGTSYTADQCAEFEEVRTACPTMCKLCPATGQKKSVARALLDLLKSIES